MIFLIQNLFDITIDDKCANGEFFGNSSCVHVAMVILNHDIKSVIRSTAIGNNVLSDMARMAGLPYPPPMMPKYLETGNAEKERVSPYSQSQTTSPPSETNQREEEISRDDACQVKLVYSQIKQVLI